MALILCFCQYFHFECLCIYVYICFILCHKIALPLPSSVTGLRVAAPVPPWLAEPPTVTMNYELANEFIQTRGMAARRQPSKKNCS